MYLIITIIKNVWLTTVDKIRQEGLDMSPFCLCSFPLFLLCKMTTRPI